MVREERVQADEEPCRLGRARAFSENKTYHPLITFIYWIYEKSVFLGKNSDTYDDSVRIRRLVWVRNRYCIESFSSDVS